VKGKAQIKEKIKERYGQIAVGNSSSCYDLGVCCSNSGIDPTLPVIAPLQEESYLEENEKCMEGKLLV